MRLTASLFFAGTALGPQRSFEHGGKPRPDTPVTGVTDWLTAIGSMGTFAVIAASASAALFQLRHMRAANQLEAILAMEEHFRDPELQAAFVFVQNDLPTRLKDAAYRDELERRGFVDSQAHPELLVCNWFNKIGLLLKRRIVSEETFMDLYSRLIAHYWNTLAPVIVLMRRTHTQGEYNDFEYLALRAKNWLRSNHAGTFPKGVTREPLADPWERQ